MKKSIVLPSAIQICVDDVGWFLGSDDRYLGRPSRTGMTRRHVPEDYIALNEVGKAIGQKLICALVLGEWDKDNILRYNLRQGDLSHCISQRFSLLHQNNYHNQNNGTLKSDHLSIVNLRKP